MNGLSLQKLAPRELVLIAGSSALLLVTALALFVGKPLYTRFQTGGAERDELRSFLQIPQTAVVEPLEQEVEAMRASLEGDLKTLPERQLESYMLSVLQSASWQHDVKLVNIEPVANAVEFPYRELGFRIELTGAYGNLDSWLRSVSTQLGFVVFNEYVLKVKAPGAEPDPELSARILLSAYRMRDNG